MYPREPQIIGMRHNVTSGLKCGTYVAVIADSVTDFIDKAEIALLMIEAEDATIAGEPALNLQLGRF